MYIHIFIHIHIYIYKRGPFMYILPSSPLLETLISISFGLISPSPFDSFLILYLYNCGTNMSINGDWINKTPRPKRATWVPMVNAGVFLIFSMYDSSFVVGGILVWKFIFDVFYSGLFNNLSKQSPTLLYTFGFKVAIFFFFPSLTL